MEEPMLVPLDLLRPTQMAVGMRAVAAKRDKLAERKRKKIKKFLRRRPIPAVLGPEGSLYMVDRHHMTLALLHCDVREAFVRVIDEWAHLSVSSFWKRMCESGRAHLFDERGRKVSPQDLPPAIDALRHDPYRDLAWSVREAGGFSKSWTPYAEFAWANFYRERIPLSMLRKNYGKASKLALKLSRSLEAVKLPGFVAN